MGKSCGEVSVRGQPELDGAKPWRGQCSGPGAARKMEMRGQDRREKLTKTSFVLYPPTPVEARGSAQGSTVLWGPDVEDNFFCSIGIQRGRLAPKVRGIEAGLGPDLDGEKLWRGQCSGPGSARKMRGIEARLGPELDGAKSWRGQCSGPGAARRMEIRGQDRRENGRKLLLFSRDSEGAFGTESPRNRGSELDGEKLWRGQCSGPGSARKMEENFFCSIGIQRARLAPREREREGERQRQRQRQRRQRRQRQRRQRERERQRRQRQRERGRERQDPALHRPKWAGARLLGVSL